MIDLAPTIYRQRAVIEGVSHQIITADQIKQYLSELSSVLRMITILEPVTHRSDLFGEAGWIHWETSGAHFYAWETPFYFFSVDIYTCKAFDINDAVEFTKGFFDCKEIEFKEY